MRSLPFCHREAPLRGAATISQHRTLQGVEKLRARVLPDGRGEKGQPLNGADYIGGLEVAWEIVAVGFASLTMTKRKGPHDDKIRVGPVLMEE